MRKNIPPSLSAGCSPPTPPVNGSVGEFISSRVGAQVTYSCDTNLVLVGERVATCSLPSLQWITSSDDILCIQPSTTKTARNMDVLNSATSTPSIQYTYFCIYHRQYRFYSTKQEQSFSEQSWCSGHYSCGVCSV